MRIFDVKVGGGGATSSRLTAVTEILIKRSRLFGSVMCLKDIHDVKQTDALVWMKQLEKFIYEFFSIFCLL